MPASTPSIIPHDGYVVRCPVEPVAYPRPRKARPAAAHQREHIARPRPRACDVRANARTGLHKNRPARPQKAWVAYDRRAASSGPAPHAIFAALAGMAARGAAFIRAWRLSPRRRNHVAMSRSRRSVTPTWRDPPRMIPSRHSHPPGAASHAPPPRPRLPRLAAALAAWTPITRTEPSRTDLEAAPGMEVVELAPVSTGHLGIAMEA